MQIHSKYLKWNYHTFSKAATGYRAKEQHPHPMSVLFLFLLVPTWLKLCVRQPRYEETLLGTHSAMPSASKGKETPIMVTKMLSRHHVQRDKSSTKGSLVRGPWSHCTDLAEAEDMSGHQGLRKMGWVGQGEGCFDWTGEIDARVQLKADACVIVHPHCHLD